MNKTHASGISTGWASAHRTIKTHDIAVSFPKGMTLRDGATITYQLLSFGLDRAAVNLLFVRGDDEMELNLTGFNIESSVPRKPDKNARLSAVVKEDGVELTLCISGYQLPKLLTREKAAPYFELA